VPVASCSRIVAYRELARGHDCRLQRPVTLYSLRQKFFSLVVLQTSELRPRVTSRNLLYLKGAELLVDDLPNYLV
jgi:hypothetical protein